jgi:hypothetical protein
LNPRTTHLLAGQSPHDDPDDDIVDADDVGAARPARRSAAGSRAAAIAVAIALLAGLAGTADAQRRRRKSRKAKPKPAPAAPAAPAEAAPTPAPAGSSSSAGAAAAEPTGKGQAKVFDFTGLDLQGRMRTPQLLYFLDRASEELDRASLERRSFIPEMVRSLDEESL